MKYKINTDRILYSPLGEEVVVFDKQDNEYITFNETMCLIFKELEKGTEVDQISEVLLSKYEVDIETCKGSLNRSIISLLERGFIVEN